MAAAAAAKSSIFSRSSFNCARAAAGITAGLPKVYSYIRAASQSLGKVV
jgi:hypothetical protein